MPDEEILSDWVTAKEAAEIISRNSGREIPPAYINQLVRQNRLEPRKLDERTNQYRRDQVDKIRVRKRGTSTRSGKKIVQESDQANNEIL
jgi:hypothetical protein